MTDRRPMPGDSPYAKFEIWRAGNGWLSIEFELLRPGDKFRRLGDGPTDVWRALGMPIPLPAPAGNMIIDCERWAP